MKKVITYGTYDLLHQGHINLLQRAKALGDYLIVGVTNDNFDRERGKLNVVNNVLERVDAVKATGLADKIIIEDYFGQKIDDIQRYGADIFAIGSDWEGKFDYLNEYCQVVYLPRTEGISSTQLREKKQKRIRIGIAGCGLIARRFVPESRFVNGIEIAGVYDIDSTTGSTFASSHSIAKSYPSLDAMLHDTDAIYISTPHLSHYEYSRRALEAGKHVLCEIPLALEKAQAEELYALANSKGLTLMEAHKTAHCPAFNHLMAMIKSGAIGEVVDIEASLSRLLPDRSRREFDPTQAGGSMYESAVYPLLPIFKLLGTCYNTLHIYSRMENGVDIYTKGVMHYPKAICSFKIGLGVKTEGNLVISGTKGYAYVQAPWWKTDYFELRYEDLNQNKKYFYKWDGEGLRYEIHEWISCIINKRSSNARLSQDESIAMAGVMQQFTERRNFTEI